ncbi:hypothetical protein [uncultured Paenibacillus sp.]|uniref:hypothetical protein n=1 Tax=uncultured Paenibacillus sp. TaxID=227322 RepID=UPI0015ABDE90|nr:hypothetical protein [uncultured Paenibacillus sp.]DAW22629.1 MAG TPA: hypothetical protein [Caudoviricetes sp.]
MTTIYREVKRKANVGERIRVVDKRDWRYENGDEFVVVRSERTGVFVEHPQGRCNGCAGVFHSEYVVLEPIAKQTPAPPQQLDFPEALVLFMRENAAAVRKYLDEIAPEKAPVTQSKPLTRADVIAKAKADVAELTEKMRSTVRQQFGNYAFKNMHLRPEFHVNRATRAVTALVRKDGAAMGYADGEVVEKSTAKAAPGDVFHAEIGKAIALRRALGLPVPDEYINAPQPDEPRVGMTVRVSYDMTHPIRTIERKHATIKNGWWFTNGFWASTSRFTVIDDTDVDYKEAA